MKREHFLPALFTEAEPADIVVETDDSTYIGRYDRSQFDASRPAEEQAIWSIRLIDNSTNGTIKTLYPNGLKTSVFVWNNRESYTYIYAL